MKLSWPVEIAGTGMSVPQRVVTNDELAGRIDTSDEWIVQRTGIRQRYWRTGPEESTLMLAKRAAQAALADAGLAPEDLDLIVIATVTPEHPLPATACLLQAELGCRWIPGFDFNAACSGFVWAMSVAAQQVVCGVVRNVLVIGAETLTNITDMEDRATCILFGDAAGAAILRPAQSAGRQIIAARWGADGERGRLIMVPAGGAHMPASHLSVDERLHYMKMQGREVYKFAVTQMQAIMRETCEDAGVSLDDIKLVIPHQSNLRIIESAAEKAGLPREKLVVNIDRYGNTSAASVAVALHESRAAGRIAPGDLVMLVAFGAGLTWGSLLFRM